MIRIVLADDQALVRTGFRMILRSEPDLDIVAEAADGHAAIHAARQHRPDVLLMDIRMPGLDGIAATRELLQPHGGRGEAPAPRVLILTTFDLDDYVYEALHAGASGFLLKDAPAHQLIDAIHVVHAGDSLLAPSVTRRLIADMVTRTPPRRPAALDTLTPREHQVLLHIARGRSNHEIAHTLTISEETVKTHVARILMKLHLRDRVQAVVLAYETGLLRPGDPDT